MKIVFFGSSEFAVPSLELLLKSQHDVLAVVTQPDREKGRDRVLAPTPVKEAASKEGIKVLQPENVNDPSFSEVLKKLSADLFVVVAFGQILAKDTLDIPELYSINLHASMLPKYRGAGPVNWTIIKGETKTGLTIIKMNERMDAGDIMLQRKVPIEAEDTAKSLSSRLSYLGGVLVLDAIRFIELDKIKFKRQPKKAGVLAPKLKKEDGLINWGKPAKEVRNRIRGCTPWPGA